METLLDLIHEFRSLEAERAPTAESRARWLGLRSLLVGDTAFESTPTTALAASHAVSFTVPGGFGRGEIRTLSGEGVVIVTRKPPAIGTRLLVRIEDRTGDALILPAVVAYRGRTHFGSFGARFDGAPERIISDGTPAIGWQPMLRFSRTRAETGVA